VQERGKPGDRRHHVREDAEGAAEPPATRRTRLVPRADPLTGLDESADTAEMLVVGRGHITRSRRDPPRSC
jgi:hypothetical protein